ncbi:MAG: FAD-binding oxidoreductase [Pseudomonadota bacterium]
MDDIVIVGGGIIGSCTAFHLAAAGVGEHVRVIEPDPTYQHAATPKSSGGVRIQFALSDNVQMSQYGHQFYREFGQRMAIGEEAPDVGLINRGYLYLAGTPNSAAMLERNLQVQEACGAKVELLDQTNLRDRFPLINVEDVVVGAHSPDDVIIDPHSALMGVRRKAIHDGVTYVNDRVVEFERVHTRVHTVRLESGEVLRAEWFVNAANCWAPELSAAIGMPVPVVPLPRNTFYYECADQLASMPLTRHLEVPGSFRPEGRGFITGYTPSHASAGFNWEIDYPIFEELLWPNLAKRVTAFERSKLKSAWACHYDQNTLDGNLILGNWPGQLDNYIIACGLSGHGLQHAPAIGRAVAEFIVQGRYQSLDLSAFGYQRVVDERPLNDPGPHA